MENLDNWHMLSNAFVAEETEEILTPEIITEYEQQQQQQQEEEIPETTKIKEEPNDECNENEVGTVEEQEPEQIIGEPEEEEEDAEEEEQAAVITVNEDICIKQELEQEQEHENENASTNNKTTTTTTTMAIASTTNDKYNIDDDAIFNFDMEVRPAVTPTGRPLRAAVLSKTGTSFKHDIDEPLDYECAILYICPACGRQYFSHDAWKRHLHLTHEFNTRSGLNFVKIDKLYHRCRECSKHIAMHSMENLLKHKFTHLPFRCTKCRICLRQYKYRQDLLVHLRMTHNKELKGILQTGKWEEENKVIAKNEQREKYLNKNNEIVHHLAIKEIKANAVDIYADSRQNNRSNNLNDIIMDDDDVCVQNERLVLEDDEDVAEQQQHGNLIHHSSFNRRQNLREKSLLETALNTNRNNNNEMEKDGISSQELEQCAPYIMHVCPQCGDTFETQPNWQHHIEFKHNFGTAEGLGFTLINNNEQAMCFDCAKTVYNAVEEMRTHRFTHTRHRNWLRCSLCYRSFTLRKDLVRHLLLQHNIAGVDDDADEEDGNSNNNQQSTSDAYAQERDVYQPHIEYLCPQCGRSYKDKKLWRRHLIYAHRLADLKVLNFRVINESQVRCLECDKIITNAYGIHNAQQHRFTHMPHKAYIRCRICGKSYTDRKGCVKHIRAKHQGYLQTLDQIYNAKQNVHNNSQNNNSNNYTNSSNGNNNNNHNNSNKRTYMQDELNKEIKRKKKEIVRTTKYLFEIVYLDEQQHENNEQSHNNDFNDDESDTTLERSLLISNASYKCQDCAARFSNANGLQAHISEVHEHKAKKVCRSESPQQSHNHSIDDEFYQEYMYYLCPACGKQFAEYSTWRHHLNDIHLYDQRRTLNFKPISPYSYSCLQCGHIADAKLRALQEHLFKHLRHPQYIVCRLCKAAVSRKQHMYQHLQIQHQIYVQDANSKQTTDNSMSEGNAKLQTPTSSSAAAKTITVPHNAALLATTQLATTEYTHNAVDHETITYFCPACNQNFDTHYMWRRHIVSVHNLNNCEGLNFRQIDQHHYICLQCYKRVTVTHTKGAICQLQSHKFRHLPYRSFKCTACKELFVRKQMFFKHLNRFTNRCATVQTTTKNVSKTINSTARQLLTQLSPSPQPTPTHSPLLTIKASSSTSVAAAAATAVSTANLSATLRHSIFEVKDEIKDNNDDEDEEENLQKSPPITGFIFICPACGQDFGDQQLWREHINTVHNLGTRSALNFRRISAKLHQCLQCREQVHGKKLRDLQTHQFKHMPYTSFLRCTLCKSSYTHLRNMKDHMRNKHSELNFEKQTREPVTVVNTHADDLNDDEAFSIKSSEEAAEESRSSFNNFNTDHNSVNYDHDIFDDHFLL